MGLASCARISAGKSVRRWRASTFGPTRRKRSAASSSPSPAADVPSLANKASALSDQNGSRSGGDHGGDCIPLANDRCEIRRRSKLAVPRGLSVPARIGVVRKCRGASLNGPAMHANIIVPQQTVRTSPAGSTER